jgi:hypothetical protein
MILQRIKRKNKKGWIKILEAFIAIIMLISVILLVVNHEKYETKETSNLLISQSAFLVLVQTNETFRNEILALDVSSSSYEIDDEGFPSNLKNYIESEFSGRTTCLAKICNTTSECSMENYPEKEVFSRSAIITSNLQEFDPKKLSLFCHRD